MSASQIHTQAQFILPEVYCGYSVKPFNFVNVDFHLIQIEGQFSMSHVIRKPDFCLFEKQRHRSASQ